MYSFITSYFQVYTTLSFISPLFLYIYYWSYHFAHSLIHNIIYHSITLFPYISPFYHQSIHLSGHFFTPLSISIYINISLFLLKSLFIPLSTCTSNDEVKYKYCKSVFDISSAICAYFHEGDGILVSSNVRIFNVDSMNTS